MKVKYKVIYADPPWSYENKKTGRTNGNQPQGSGAHAKYPTMTLEEIMAMPIKDIAAKDSVCFMWATVPLMPEAFAVLNAWGYQYKTMLTWRKIMSLGMGYWFRGQCEHLLLGVRGKVKAFGMQEPNFIQSKAGLHSRKPVEFKKLIERATVDLNPKVELFERGVKDKGMFPDYESGYFDGWDVYGNEVENSIKLPLEKVA